MSPEGTPSTAHAGTEHDEADRARESARERPFAASHDLGVTGSVTTASRRRGDGWAPIKAEYIRSKEEILSSAEAATPETVGGKPVDKGTSDESSDKKQEDEKKGRRGRNKKRPKDHRPAHADVLCSHVSAGNTCNFGTSCRFSHDVKGYLEKKGLDIAGTCPVWDVRGMCPSGLKCRFGNAHTDPETLKPIKRPGAKELSTLDHINDLDRDLQAKLRRNQVPFACDRKGWPAFLASLDAKYPDPQEPHPPYGDATAGPPEASGNSAAIPPERGDEASAVAEPLGVPQEAGTHGSDRSNGLGKTDKTDADATALTPGKGICGKEDERRAGADEDMPLAKRVRVHQAAGDATQVPAGMPEGDGVLGGKKSASGDSGTEQVDMSAGRSAVKDLGNGDTCEAGKEEMNGFEETSKRQNSCMMGEWVRSCVDGPHAKEKRSIDFEGKVYVAPLTTVGNLPFRRIMKDFGADITCGEMALSNQILKGNGSEWALLRRHPCEDVFGVQVAGAHPDQMTRVAELLEDHTKVDFVDINMGCPIDLVCEKGMGAALMGRARKLRGIVAGMTSQLSCPLTVKMRVGWDEKKPNADNVVRVVQREAERSRSRGFPGSVAHVMIHGRSRLQRYSKLADWAYVRKVAALQDPLLPPLPVIGNGDILSWRDHEEHLAEAKELDDADVDSAKGRRYSTCCMLARGALIKPWLPTEVKEKRDWDISSSERLDIYRNFANYGLEHWGSDQMGVNKTRRFLLEWLSFTCRYIPVGILEVLPQRINERPLPYNGRDELESLMCSQNPGDWVKISEMLLGPVPEGFDFIPKHKANSYAPQAAAIAAATAAVA